MEPIDVKSMALAHAIALAEINGDEAIIGIDDVIENAKKIEKFILDSDA